MAIYYQLIEEIMEVFMNNLSAFGDFFDLCPRNLERDKLTLNREKWHFMVKEGIILGHKISHREIKVDKAKIKVIESFPHQPQAKASGVP